MENRTEYNVALRREVPDRTTTLADIFQQAGLAPDNIKSANNTRAKIEITNAQHEALKGFEAYIHIERPIYHRPL